MLSSILVISLYPQPKLGHRETRRLHTRQTALLADFVYPHKVLQVRHYALRNGASTDRAHANFVVGLT